MRSASVDLANHSTVEPDVGKGGKKHETKGWDARLCPPSSRRESGEHLPLRGGLADHFMSMENYIEHQTTSSAQIRGPSYRRILSMYCTFQAY